MISCGHIPLIVQLRCRSLEERNGIAVGAFFLFWFFFLSLTIACGNVGNSKAVTARAGLRTNSPTRGMVTRRLSNSAQAGSQTHTQMLSFEDSAIRVVPCFWRAVKKKGVEMKEMERPIRAWIGVDWSDQKHDVSLY